MPETLVNATALVLSEAAWPIAFLAMIIILKSNIKSLLGRISRIRHGDTELSLEQQVQATFSGGTDEVSQHRATILGSSTAELASRPPIDAIVTSWVAVERALDRLPGKTFAPGRPRFPTARRLSELQESGAITSSLAQRIRELQMIRNRAVHEADPDLSEYAVRIYVDNAAEVVAELEQALDKSSGGVEDRG